MILTHKNDAARNTLTAGGLQYTRKKREKRDEKDKNRMKKGVKKSKKEYKLVSECIRSHHLIGWLALLLSCL